MSNEIKKFKFIFLVIGFIFMQIHLLAVESGQECISTYNVSVSKLNVRSAPNSNSEIVGKLNKNTQVCVDKYNENWAHIASGWISKKYITRISKEVQNINSTQLVTNYEVKQNTNTNNSGQNNGYENYQIFLIVYFIMMIYTIFRGAGENRTLVVFQDYNDLGLTFMIPASFVLIYILFTAMGGDPRWGAIISSGVAFLLLIILIRNTYVSNEGSITSTFLSFMTKVPLGIIWIVYFIIMLKPNGSTAAERRASRGTAMIVLAFLTPILSLVVVDKEGSVFNPRDWVRGRRIGSIRSHL